MVERILLVRHAEAESNAANVLNGDPQVHVPLTGRGREQARALGDRLSDKEVHAVVTSEFPRAVETAQLATDGRDEIPTVVLPELNDPRGGAWEGRDLDDYLAWAAEAAPDDAPPGGESMRQVFARVAAAWVAILRRPERVLLVVGHGLPISVTLAAVRADLDDRSVYDRIENAQVFEVSRAELERATERIERAVAG